MKEKTISNSVVASNNIDVADGVRGFAIIIVLLYHAFGNIMISLGGYSSRTGIFGVILFFILSSFLLSTKFITKGFKLNELISYFLGRFIRIIPLFAFATYTYYALGLIDFNKMLSVLAFESTYAHLWTIPLEFKFYFVLPIVVYISYLIDERIGKPFVFVFLGLVSAMSYINILNELKILDRVWSPVFVMGIAVCFIYKAKKFTLPPMLSDAIISFLFIIMVFLTPAVQFYFFGHRPQLTETVVFLWAGVTSAFCYFCLCSTGFIAKCLKGKILRSFGKWSFSIYLFHWAVIMICANYKKNDLAVFLFSVVQSVGLGALIYYIVEAPIEKLRHIIMNLIKLRLSKAKASVAR